MRAFLTHPAAMWRIMAPMRRDLPSGTVTFLFTDVEGSTKLLHELGDAYADLLGGVIGCIAPVS